MEWFRGWTMVLYFCLLVYGAYGYAVQGNWMALALFGTSISGVVLCEIRFQVDKLKEATK
jgi:hypothetical protein